MTTGLTPQEPSDRLPFNCVPTSEWTIAAQEAELIAAYRARRTPINCPFCKQEIQASDRLFHLRCTHPEISDLKQPAAAWLLNVPKNEVGARVPRTSQAKKRYWTVDQLEQYLETKSVKVLDN